MHDNLLHIYGQAWPHDTVHIVGTRAGLEALLHAVGSALLGRAVSPPPVFAADGEGYTLEVRLVSDEALLRYVRPYTDAAFRDEADAGPQWPLRRERHPD